MFKNKPLTRSDEMIAERLEAIHEELVKLNKHFEADKATIAASVPSEDVMELSVAPEPQKGTHNGKRNKRQGG